VDIQRTAKMRSAHRASRAEVRAGKSGVAETRCGGVAAKRTRV
jgi:hypothetical protein